MARRFLPPFLLLAVIFFAYVRLFTAEFTALDDHGTVAYNPKFIPPTVQSFRNLWTEPDAGLFIPITYSAWWFLVALGPASSTPGPSSDPTIFHLANIIAHAGASVVVWSILRRFVCRKDWVAFCGAALFAIHPLQVESVAWISGFKDVLCGLFSLLAIRFYLVAVEARAALHPSAADRARSFASAHYWIGMAAFAIAMLCKPTATVTPAIALALDVWLNRRTLRAALLDLWPWFMLAIPCMLWTKHFQDRLYLPGVPLWGRPLIATDALAYYLAKLVFPANLTMDPGRRPDWTWSTGAPFYTWILPAAGMIGIYIYRKRFPWLVAAGLAMLIALLPVLGFLPFAYQAFSTVAGHYMYLPMLGPAIAVTGLLAYSRARWLRFFCAFGLVFFTLRTFVENGYWKDNFVLFDRMIEVNPRSYFAHDLLGRAHAHQEKFDLAAYHYGEAIKINPEYTLAHRDLGDLMLRLGNAMSNRALLDQGVDHLQIAVDQHARQRPEQRPEDTHARLVLAGIYRSLGRTDEARRELLQTIAETPEKSAVAEAKAQLDQIDAANLPPSTRPATSTPS